MILLVFLIWFYHVPAIQGLEYDEKESAEATYRHTEEISFESAKNSFLRLQQKYDTR
jgi:hypothetical protein